MKIWLRAGCAAFLLAALAAIAAVGGLSLLDRSLTDARFSFSGLKATGQVVVVDIDSNSIAEIGVWPWSRQLHADVLNNLMTMGASQVAFDVDFSSASTPEGDAAFARALQAAGGFAFLAAFIQATPTGIALTLPDAAFLAAAEPVLVNVLLDAHGLADSFMGSLSMDGRSPSTMPATLSGRPTGDQPSIGIDFGIDAHTIDRVPFVDVLKHRVDASRIAGKDIIVGASAIELRDYFRVPRFGVISGPMLQALGTETLLQGRALVHWGPWASLALAAIGAIVLVLLGGRAPLRILALGMLGAIIGWELVAALLYISRAILLDTAPFLLAMPALFLLELASEFAAQNRQRHNAQMRLAHVARNDELTGTLSRIGLLEDLPGLGASGSAILVKMARLDSVRAALGQEVADAALRFAAASLKTHDPALLAYVREDTFALLFRGALDPAAFNALCGRIEAAIGGVHLVDNHAVYFEVAMSTSAGVNTGDLLLRQAEIALIHNSGARTRNSFDDTQVEAIEFRRRLDIDLRAAIAGNQLHLLFQPQVSLADGRLIGAEALVRWHHPELGLVSPALFVPLAEETGAIVDLGRWVLRQACQKQADWNWTGRLSVNVSPIQFELSDLVKEVDTALTRANLPANWLDIEVTEGILIRDPDRAKLVMEALSQRGVGLALDDFGTGYSALSSLTTLRFDKVKIDQSFVRRLGVSPADDALLRTIVDLCQRQHKLSIAEGIETAEQAEQLKSWGCDIGQGFYYSKPLDAAQFEVFIAENSR